MIYCRMKIIKTFEDKEKKELVVRNRFIPFMIVFDVLFLGALLVGAIMKIPIQGINLPQPMLYFIVIGGLAFVNWGLVPIKNVFVLDKKLKTLTLIQTPCFSIKRRYEIKLSEQPILVGRKKLIARLSTSPFRPFVYYKKDGEMKVIPLFPWLWFWFDKINWHYAWNWREEELKEVSEFLGIPLKFE